MPRNGYAHMVLDDYVDRVRDIYIDRKNRLAAVRTRKQALTYQENVQKAISRAFGPRPRKTPLNAQITGTVHRRGYRIENILFEIDASMFTTPARYVHKSAGTVQVCS